MMKFTLMTIMFGLVMAPALADDHQRIEDSRALSQSLQQQLGAELMAAMNSEGPVYAIQVCNEKAPKIAQSISDDNVMVSRTALRVRNPSNASTGEQKAVMEYFVARLEKDPSNAPEVLFTDTEGKQQYMRAIVMQPQCAACHGHSVQPQVQQAILEKYPDDTATGFKVGDLRGSFVVKWLD
jgi:cytochrome c1